MVLILSVWGTVRFFAALRWWDVLSEFGSSLSPLYLSVIGAGWAVAGGVLISAIYRRQGWARLGSFAFILLWLIEYWIERIFFQAQRANLPFALTLSLLTVVITWILTFLSGTQSFFLKSEEYEQPVEKSNTA
jgi:hypothetical protein